MIMATTARRNTQPMSYYWGLVKDMDDSQKLELVTMLIDSVKPAVHKAEPTDKEHGLAPFTMEEIDDMLDEAEAAFEAGDYLTNDEVFHHRKETVAI